MLYTNSLILITMGVQRVTNTPYFTGCPTITISNEIKLSAVRWELFSL